jgi:hypothetical protein
MIKSELDITNNAREEIKHRGKALEDEAQRKFVHKKQKPIGNLLQQANKRDIQDCKKYEQVEMKSKLTFKPGGKGHQISRGEAILFRGVFWSLENCGLKTRV